MEYRFIFILYNKIIFIVVVFFLYLKDLIVDCCMFYLYGYEVGIVLEIY